MKKNQRRLPSEINAGSMADIAFLLLIFFLVTTTIVQDQGILVKLPPWMEEPPPISDVNERNLLPVNINTAGLFWVENEETSIKELRDIAKEFITNPKNRTDLPVSPTKAIISIRNDRGTPYHAYLSVYNEIKGAYNEVWNEKARQEFQKDFEALSSEQQKTIRDQWPQIISEAEPTDFAKAEL